MPAVCANIGMLLGEGLAKHPVGYRLTAVDYSTGDSYHYAYDSVGNRLTQDRMVNGREPALSNVEVSSVSYNYDIANRLADVGGEPYVYDANGNASINSAHRLLSDGQNTYAHDAANRLTSVLSPSPPDNTIFNFRVGVNLYPANPPIPFEVNPSDKAALQSLDNQLVFLKGNPGGRAPGLWNKYIDIFGNVYYDEFGNIGGLRTDEVHILPK